MRFVLSQFAARLRAAGLPVSPAELLDAAAALRAGDLADRAALHAVLGATLVKRREERTLFDAVFARYFATPVLTGRRRRRGPRPAAGGEPAARAAAGAGGGGGAPPRASPPRTGGPPRGPDRDRPRAGRGRIVRPRPPREAVARQEHAAPGRTRPEIGRKATERGARGRVAARHRPFRAAWTAAQERELADELARVVQRWRARRVRRRRLARRGPLWVQRVVRLNVGHDGVPLRLVRRTRARREPRLLLLVDVSHSTRRCAAAFLTLAAAAATAFRRAEVLLFVDRAVDASALLPRLARLDGRAARLDALAAGLPELDPGARSDYGRVLDQVRRERARVLRQDTLLVVLGDARSNFLDPLPWALAELGERARRVVWFVPEREDEWDTGDSVLGRYLPHCDAVCAAPDLAGLVHGFRRLLRP